MSARMFPPDMSRFAAWRCEQCRRLITTKKSYHQEVPVPTLLLVAEPTLSYTTIGDEPIHSTFEDRLMVVCPDCFEKLNQEGAI